MSRRRTEARPFQRAFVRSLFAFFAAFVAAGYLAAISHMAFVAHAVCEHGKLVHVEGGAAGAASEHAREGAATPLVVAGDPAASDEHDHCILGVAEPGESAVARAPATIVPPEAPPAAAPAPAPARAPDLVAPPPPIALLLLSPKSSPPV